MSEIAAVAGLVACTGAVISAGVVMGTRYIERAVRVPGREDGQPLVRPSHPSGTNWQSDAA